MPKFIVCILKQKLKCRNGTSEILLSHVFRFKKMPISKANSEEAARKLRSFCSSFKGRTDNESKRSNLCSTYYSHKQK